MTKQSRVIVRYRNSVDGKFIPETKAERNPRESEKERIRVPAPKPKPKGR